MVDDPAVRWQQASPVSILLKTRPESFEAGHVNDVLVRGNGGLLVATDTGGVWSISAQTFAAFPLSDSWEKPDMRCLAFGPDGEDHVYAGGSALYVTDPSAPVPLFAWHSLKSLDKMNPGTIWRVAVMKSARRIVVVSDNGIFWSKIPPMGPLSPGCLGALLGITGPPWSDGHVWQQAKGTELPNGKFFGLTLGATQKIDPFGRPMNLRDVTVVVGGSQTARGVFVGQWDSADNLLMKRAHFSGALDLVQLVMAATSVVSCTSQPQVVYAVGSDDNGRAAVVVRSDDGGRIWNPCQMMLKGGGNLQSNAGTQGEDGYNGCIGVSPFDPNLVAIGWEFGPFISDNGGQLWQQARGPTHADIHSVYFDPRIGAHLGSVIGVGTSDLLYVCSDGGLASTSDSGQTFESGYNQQLLNLQYYSATGVRQSWGSIGAFPQFDGLVGGGLQDNGNCFAELGGTTFTPWTHLDGRDGGFFTPLQTGQVLHNIGLQPTPQPILASRWDTGAHTFVDTAPVLIAHSKPPAQPDPKGLIGVNSLEFVKHPKFTRRGRLMYAVASVGLDVYGLFAERNGDKITWEYLGTTPGAAPNVAWAVASVDGTNVFVGTSERRIFLLDAQNGASVEYLYDRALNPTGTFIRIVPYSNTRAFAIQNWDDHGTVIALRGLVWAPAGSGLPDSPFFALEGARNITNDTLLAATDDRVFISYDEAKTWGRASKGLPRCPHCADLRFVKDHRGAQRIYLGTFGRSLWVANLLPDVDGSVHSNH